MQEFKHNEFVTVVTESGQSGPIARVTLNRADLHNAFNETMIQEIRNVFTVLDKDPAVRAVILQGEGKSFCAGADLNWMKQMVDYSFAENVSDAHHLSAMLSAIYHCSKPVIARVHGAAFGGGVGLIAACDMAFATESATFCLSEVKLGLLPAVISPFVVKKIGEGNARRYFLTAERFQATEANRIGLLSGVSADVDALDSQIEAIVSAITANGPNAVSESKVLIDRVCHTDWDRAVDITTKLIANQRISKEGQEGMKAFLEKRSPAWVSAQAKSEPKTSTPAGKD